MTRLFTDEERARALEKRKRKVVILPNGDIDLKSILTRGQLQVFIPLCENEISDVAMKLNLAERTVKYHIKEIKKKLGTFHRGIWFRMAVRQGLLTV